jgi:predicted DNA-binding transcriptional regulator YafY
MKRRQKGRLSRPPWDRMMRIHERIQSGKFPNCVGMSKDMGVCLRTVKRDVEFMKERLKMPIEYDERKHGFYYSKPVDKFPGLPMTESELFALLVAHKAIAQYHDTPFQKPLDMAFRKLAGQLDSKERYSLTTCRRRCRSARLLRRTRMSAYFRPSRARCKRGGRWSFSTRTWAPTGRGGGWCIRTTWPASRITGTCLRST